MKPIVVERHIEASVDRVFQTIADIRHFSQAVPHITNVEFLSESTSGLGTRFRETRLMQGKEASTELEVTEYVVNERIRLVADSHGTLWDTLFTVASQGTGTKLTMHMDGKAHQWIARLMNPLIRGMIAKAVAADMDAVKAYCENSTA